MDSIISIGIGVGAIPVSKASSTDDAWGLGYVLYDNGCSTPRMFEERTFGRCTAKAIIVRLDLDANTIAFWKSSEATTLRWTRHGE